MRIDSENIKGVYVNETEAKAIIINNSNIVWPYIDKEMYVKFSTDKGVTYNYLTSDENGNFIILPTKPVENNKKWKINLNKDKNLLLRPNIALDYFLKYDNINTIFSLVEGIEINNNIFINKNETIVAEEYIEEKSYTITTSKFAQTSVDGLQYYLGSTTISTSYPIKSVVVTRGDASYLENGTDITITVSSGLPNVTISGSATITMYKSMNKTITKTIDNINLIDNDISDYIITNVDSSQAGQALGNIINSNFSKVELSVYENMENTLELPDGAIIFKFEE